MSQRSEKHNAKRWLPQAVGHSIAYQEHGPQAASRPWLTVHGGPGGGASASILQPFDLHAQQVVVFDQRGAGNSRPRGSVRQNTTRALAQDIEALRVSCGVSKWSILAGSWGSVVALAYVAAHPDRVEQMVLRGSFALSRREVRGVLLGVEYGAGASLVGQIARSRWLPAPGHQLAAVSRLLQSGALGVAALHAVRRWNLIELSLARKGILRSVHALVAAGDTKVLNAQRRFNAQLSRQWRKQQALLNRARASKSDQAAWRKFRVQAHYLKKSGFMKPFELDRAVIKAAASDVKMDWVHGRFDSICPPSNTRRWAAMAARHASDASMVRIQWAMGGHLSVEAPVLDALRLAVRQGMEKP